MEQLDRVLSRLKGVKRSGNGFAALCPAHDDQHQSLSVSEGWDGRVLLKCHAGCRFEEIVRAMGLEVSDCFPPKAPKKRKAKPERKIVGAYRYVDESGNLLFEVVRYEPKSFAQRRPDGKGGWIYNINGVRRVLYRLPDVLKGVESGQTVFIVEGEKDADALGALGLVATTNPHGAGKWRDEYSEALQGAHVVIVPDKDDVGRSHAEAVAKSLWGKVKSIKLVELPGDGVKDVSDFLKAGGSKERLLELVAGASEWAPAPVMRYEELRQVFERWLYLPDDTPLRFLLCAVIANRLPGDPFWAFLVGPSGSSKTELLNALTGLDFIKPLDTLTSSTFLSGRQRKDPNASLLLRVSSGTIFVMRDFSTVLEMPVEARSEIFSQFRRLYDGHLSKYTGEGGESAELHWKGKVGFIGGVTDAIERYRSFATMLGERFLYHHLAVADRSESAQRALSNRASLEEMREDLVQAVKGFFDGLKIPEHVEMSNEIMKWIVHVADFVSVARTAVERDSRSRELLSTPEPEVPTRLSQQLGALACAHAVLMGRDQVAWDDLDLVAQTALSCIPKARRNVLRVLFEAGAAIETSTVAEILDLPTTTARRDLEDLTALRLVKRIKVGEGKADLWEMTELAVLGWEALIHFPGAGKVIFADLKDPKPTFPAKSPPRVCASGHGEGDVGIRGGEKTGKVPQSTSGSDKVTLPASSSEAPDDMDCPF